MKKLGFGMMRLPLLDPQDDGRIDIELTKKMADEFIERGFNYFDTAWMYCGHKSENAVKEVLSSRYPRKSFMLASKLPGYVLKSGEDCEKVFGMQLEKTGAGYFDRYLLHDINSCSIENFEKCGCFDFIRRKKAEGLIKEIGFSFHDGPELLDKVLTENPDMDFVQLQINYLDWESMGVQSRRCYEVARRHNKPIIVMEPVKGGTLAKLPAEAEKMLYERNEQMSVSSWAVRFAASLEGVMLVLSGMSSMEQLMDNIGYMENFVPLSDIETDMMKKAAEIINKTITVPCTGCSYCTVNCPKNIAIPRYFSLYNADLQEVEEKSWTPQGEYYDNITKVFGKASECIGCGECEKLCPQHLPIREYLKDTAKHFENMQ